jgi:hypothetical protein
MFSEEMICCGFKNAFYKKSGGFFCAKVQNHPGSSEISRNLRKIQKTPLNAAQQNES